MFEFIKFENNKSFFYYQSKYNCGIIVSSYFNWKEQIKSALSKAKRVSGIFKRTFLKRDTDLWKKLYMSMITPHREFAVQDWNPRLICDKERLENCNK